MQQIGGHRWRGIPGGLETSRDGGIGARRKSALAVFVLSVQLAAAGHGASAQQRGSSPAPERSPFWGPSTPGPLSVSLRTQVLDADGPRPIQVLVFEPITGGSGRWTLAELVAATCVPEGQQGPPRARDACATRLLADLAEYRPGRQFEAAVLDGRLLGFRDGAPARGRFPLLLLDGGLTSDASSYFALAELVASHGVVVVSAPSLPFAAGRPLTFDAAGVRSKTNDLRRVLDAMALRPNVDSARVVVGAWSVGGVSTALLAAEDRRVAAVLSLDGGLGYDYGPELMGLLRAGGEPLDIALLHVTGTLPNPYPVPKDFTFLPRFALQAWLIELDGVNHSHFVMQGGVVPFAGDSSDESRAFWQANSALGRVVVAFVKAVTTGGASDFESTAREVLGSVGRVDRLR